MRAAGEENKGDGREDEGDERAGGDVVRALRTMAAILAKHGHTVQADFVTELARLAHTGDPAFEARVATLEMWGGSGAVWEVDLSWGSPRPAEARADTLRFRSAVIALARHLDAHAIGSDGARRRARDIAAVFEQWQRQGR